MKILIIRFSHLGDIVLTQPIVQRLHEVFPDAELYYLTKEQYKDIPALFGIPLTVLSSSKLLSSFSQLRSKQFDLIFDLQNKLNSFLIKYFCLRARTFTYDKKRSLRQAIVKHKTDRGIDSTLDLYKSALLKAAKELKLPELAEGLNNPQLILNPDVLEKIQSRLHKPDGNKSIALFPGATHKTKIYPAENLIRFIQQTGKDYHYWLLGSKEESGLTYRIHFETADRSTDLAGKFSLAELIYVIAMADAVITNDSGPMHLAAALGKPQIAIFGSTHPRLGFRPLNDKAVILCKDKSCQPCSLHGLEACPRKHFACMLSLHPEELVSALKSLL